VLVTVASAKGSPGATTTARVLASLWPSDVVLVDADPAGGDLSLWMRAPDGSPLDPERGLLTLAVEARRTPNAALATHVQATDGGLPVLCGVQAPEQVSGMGPVWPAIGHVLSSASGAVVADVGRLGPDSAALPLVEASDVLLLVARPSVESYSHLRERLRWLARHNPGPRGMPAVGIVVVADPRESRAVRDLQQLLAHGAFTAPVLGAVALDPKAADVVAGRVERGIERSLLVRSVRQLVEPVYDLASTRHFAHVTRA